MANNTGNTIIALATGITIGAGLGLLYAPQSGEKTRKQLKDEADKTRENLSKQYEAASNDLSEFSKSTKEKVESQLESLFNKASDKTDGMISKMESELQQLRDKNKELLNEIKSQKK